MRLIDDEERAISCGQVTQTVQKAGLGQHDSDVGERRFGEDRGNVAVRQLRLDATQVVELRNARGHVQRHRRSGVAAPRHCLAVRSGDCEGLVHRTVITVGEGEDLRPSGDQPREPDRPAIGVGCRQRERPQRQSEAAAELTTNPLGVGGGQHRRGAAELFETLGNGVDHGLRTVPSHATGIAEREVNVLESVHIHDPIARGALEVERKPAAPLGHPRHRHPAEEVVGSLKEFGRPGVGAGI